MVEEGKVAWLSHEEFAYVPCKVNALTADRAQVTLLSPYGEGVKVTGNGKIELTDHASTSTLSVSTKELEPMDEQSLTLVSDMAKFNDLKSPAILHNLRLCFKEERVYVGIGAILVSVNPYKRLRLYTQEHIEEYNNKELARATPHVYGMASLMLSSMIENEMPQACLVSGESGAGKTEAVRRLMEYLAEHSESASEDTYSAELQQQILQCSPLLESFGNAATIRNHNSSRFGKWTQINYKSNDRIGQITSGQIISYLLEKSRVVHQATTERNYHVFYQMLQGMRAAKNAPLREKLFLRDYDVGSYSYLSPGTEINKDKLSDQEGWDYLCQAMEKLELTEHFEAILKVVAAVLHLGNIEYEPHPAASEKVLARLKPDKKVRKALKAAAELLGISTNTLDLSLRQQRLRQLAQHEDEIVKPHTAKQSDEARDVLAKVLYGRLFDWLVLEINTRLVVGARTDDETFIGVLDIFGFESLEKNSFEQLCVNYCNEKLQFYFNEHIFKNEQDVYKEEGIRLEAITYMDNKEQLRLISHRHRGLFAMIDDAIKLAGANTDQTLLSRFFRDHEGYACLSRFNPDRPNLRPEVFKVMHYAGEVEYDITGFLKKSKDSMYDELEEVMISSDNLFVQSLHEVDEMSAEVRERGFSEYSDNSDYGVNGSRRMSMRRRSKRRSVHNPHHGFEEVSVRERGLSHIENTSTFTKKSTKSLGTQFKEQLQQLVKLLDSTEPNFIRCIKPNDTSSAADFDSQKVLLQLEYAGILQVCRIRKEGFPVRKSFEEFNERYVSLFLSGFQQDVTAACFALQKLELIHDGEWQVGNKRVFLKDAAKDRLEDAKQEKQEHLIVRIQALLRGFLQRQRDRNIKFFLTSLAAAVKAHDVALIESALSKGADLPQTKAVTEAIEQGEEEKQRLKEVQRLEGELQRAMKEANEDAIRVLLQSAESLGLNDAMVKEAHTMLKQLVGRKKLEGLMEKAMKKRDMRKLASLMKKASGLGMQPASTPILRKATAMIQRDEQVEQGVEALRLALQDDKAEEIKDALTIMEALGKLDHPLVAQAGARLEVQVKASQERERRELAALETLKAAIFSQDLAELNEANAEAEELGLSGELVEEAAKLAEAIAAKDEFLKRLAAVTDKVSLQRSAAKGLSPADLKELQEAIKFAPSGLRKADVNEEFEAAKALEAQVSEMLTVQKALLMELKKKKKNHGNLQTLVEQATTLGLDNEAVHRAEKWLRGTTMRMSADRQSLTSQGHEEMTLSEKLRVARKEQYTFQRYFLVSDDADYVRGFSERKKQELLAKKLEFQMIPIPRAILAFGDRSAKQNKRAVSLNIQLLGYCGELMKGYPAILAETNLRICLAQREMVNEMYIQVMKHLTNNPSRESSGRAWQFFCMLCSTVPPQQPFDLNVLNFLIEAKERGGLHGIYANYCISKLISTLTYKGNSPDERAFKVPVLEEITAYQYRMPVVITTQLADESVVAEDLPIPPDMQVDDILELLKNVLQMDPANVELLGLFLRYDEEKDFPIPLDGEDYLGDLVLSDAAPTTVSYTLVVKKKFYVRGENLAPSSDDHYDTISFLQALHEYRVGNWAVANEMHVIELAAYAYAVRKIKHPKARVDILKQIPLSWRDSHSSEEWLALTKEIANAEIANGVAKATQSKFIMKLSGEMLFGSSSFKVYNQVKDPNATKGDSTSSLSKSRKYTRRFSKMFRSSNSQGKLTPKTSADSMLDDSMTLQYVICSVNHRGVFLCHNNETRIPFLHMEHERISQITSTSSMVTLYKVPQVIEFQSANAHAIASFIEDYKFLNDQMQEQQRSFRQ